MKIAHVISTFPPYYSGTGMVCYYNALELGRRGHDVTVFTANHPPGDYTYPAEFQVRRLPVTYRIGNAPVLPDLLRLDGFDVVHLHHPFVLGAEFVWAATRLRKIPFMITHHNDLIGDGLRPLLFDSYSALSNRLILKSARKIAVVSQAHAEKSRLAPFFRARNGDVVEIPNGVDVDLFHPDVDGRSLRDQHDIPADAPALLFVGALDRAHHFRRVDLLIKVLAQLNDPNLYLVLAGDGDRADAYRDLAGKLGVNRQIRFLGSVEHRALPEVYAAADIVVLPSHIQESFGMVLIEAMACGKPVIASNLSGPRTIIADGQDGLLVQPGDPTDLAATIQVLLNDPQLAENMGSCGRAKVERKYAWPAIISRLEAVYQQVRKPCLN